MTQVCVNGAQVQLQPMGPQQLIPPTSMIPAFIQNLLTVDGLALLVPGRYSGLGGFLHGGLHQSSLRRRAGAGQYSSGQRRCK